MAVLGGMLIGQDAVVQAVRGVSLAIGRGQTLVVVGGQVREVGGGTAGDGHDAAARVEFGVERGLRGGGHGGAQRQQFFRCPLGDE